MTDEETEFIPIDGVSLEKRDLMKMARHCGNYIIAEHYMLPVIMYTHPKNRQKVTEEVNEIRQIYNLTPMTPPHASPASDNNMPALMPPQKTPADQARSKYRQLDVEERKRVIRNGLARLMADHPRLFNRQACWMGIYLVIRDRLDGSLRKDSFYDFATGCTPDGWEKRLRITKTTMSNFTRTLSDYEDRYQAYYDMRANPFEDLCDWFWDTLQAILLTE